MFPIQRDYATFDAKNFWVTGFWNRLSSCLGKVEGVLSLKYHLKMIFIVQKISAMVKDGPG